MTGMPDTVELMTNSMGVHCSVSHGGTKYHHEDRVSLLVEALKWYADRDRWDDLVIGRSWALFRADKGIMARKALEQWEKSRWPTKTQ